MNFNQKSADDLRRVARMLQPLADASDALDRIGSLEQAEAEANARISAANDQAAAIMAEAVQAQRDAENLKVDAERVRNEALADAEGIKADAKHEAANTLLAARTEAASLVTEAQAAAELANHDANAAMTALGEAQRMTADLETRAAEARAFLDKLRG